MNGDALCGCAVVVHRVSAIRLAVATKRTQESRRLGLDASGAARRRHAAFLAPIGIGRSLGRRCSALRPPVQPGTWVKLLSGHIGNEPLLARIPPNPADRPGWPPRGPSLTDGESSCLTMSGHMGDTARRRRERARSLVQDAASQRPELPSHSSSSHACSPTVSPRTLRRLRLPNPRSLRHERLHRPARVP